MDPTPGDLSPGYKSQSLLKQAALEPSIRMQPPSGGLVFFSPLALATGDANDHHYLDTQRAGQRPASTDSSLIWLKNIIRLICTILALSFIVFVQIDSAYAQTTPTPIVTDNQVNQVAKGLYCPVCQNLPLEVCQTAACAEWRQQVRDLIAQGYTEQQIRDYFVQRFGPQTVGVPTNPTAQILTVALPAALILIIGVVIAVNLFSWRRRRVVVDDDQNVIHTPPVDDYRTRLEKELRKRD